MAHVQDIQLGPVAANIVPSTYRRRNTRVGGRPAASRRLTIDAFRGQRQAFGTEEGGGETEGTGWDALSNGTWAAFSAADLGAGFAISGLAYYQDDLLVMLSTGQDIRKFNTVSSALTIWRTGEKGQVGCGYAGQLIYAPRAANAQEELRLSGTKWNGNAVTHFRYLDSPILNMCLFNGTVAIATRTSLYRMGGQPYPGEADDPTVTADTSKAPEWLGNPEPLMTHGQFAAGDDFTFMASFRGRLYTWLQGRVAEYGGDRTWTRMGPEGVRCYGGCAAGDWLCVAIESRYGGHELWGFDGSGWWKFFERASPPMVWPSPLAGAGNRELAVFRDGETTYDLVRLIWRAAAVNTYGAAGEWISPLLDGGEPGSVKPWTEFGAAFAAPENRGDSASSDAVTISLEYATPGDPTWVLLDNETTSAASSRGFSLRSELAAAIDARYVQLRVSWSSVSDWAPVLASVWAEYEIPEVAPPRRWVWEFDLDASDRNVRRDGQIDTQGGRGKIDALWELWQAGNELEFTDIDGGLWDPGELAGRALWLKADALSGLGESEEVASWADATSNGEVAAQVAAPNRPTFRGNVLNGRPVVRFNGSAWLRIDTQLGIGAQPFAQFAVWKPSAAGQALMIWNNNTGLLVTDFDNDLGIFSGSALFDLDHHPFGQWHMVAGVHAGAGSSLTVDGGVPATGHAGSNSPSGDLTIGAGIAGLDRRLNGDVAELIVTRTALSTPERQRLEGYAAHKWGLTASLPSNHPYKSVPPLRGPRVKIDQIEEQVARPGDAGRWGEAVVHGVLDEV
jgi:hypothetical protein